MPSGARIAAPLIYVLWLLPLLSLVLAQTPPEATNYIVSVDAAGSAVWTIEHRFLLQTDDDEQYFEEYVKTFDSQRQAFLERFINETNELVERSSILTGRSMSAENFTVIEDKLSTATGKFGLIVYSFRWLGFARRGESSVIIGDVFEGGLYLYKDDTFSVRAPTRFAVIYVSPPPDVSREGELIWYGLRNFGSGEPRVEYSLEATTVTSQTLVSPPVTTDRTSSLPSTTSGSAETVGFGLSSWLLWFLLAMAAILPTSAVVLRRRKRSMLLEDDEQKVIRVLREAGGVLFQSDIKRKTGFSKAKTSVVLKTLEQKGSIEKTRRGREYVVRLREW